MRQPYQLSNAFPIKAIPARAGALIGALSVALATLLWGCGGQDFGGFQRGLGGDLAPGMNTSISSRGQNGNGTTTLGRGTYPMIEASFQLPSVPGDPFDYEQVNVQVTIRKPDNGTVDLPAFYDGDKTWHVRYTPSASGQYSVVTVKLNREIAHEEKLTPKDWNVRGNPKPGFVRIDHADHTRFVHDDGGRYYPIGQNQAWHSESLPDIPALFDKMHTAGENWSRVWMDHWDGKNLDWPVTGKPDKLGQIDLTVAKRWDTIVQAADKNDIYFQMVLQHHGQYASKSGFKYSSNTDSNWDENPYNVKNGGFLKSPEAFFSDPQARTLTKRKLYYILSRWGYSPNVMAFELFNEVEGTDAGHGKLYDSIALWHREMSLFLKQFDPYRHLITTSSAFAIPFANPIWETVDYVQIHTYPQDILTALGGIPSQETLTAEKKLGKPIFIGEFGTSNLADPNGVALHAGVWASMMSSSSGAAEFWNWDEVEKHNLYSRYLGATAFITTSGIANHSGLVSTALPIDTPQRANLSFGPGGGFAAATQTEFVVGANGAPPGMDKFPAFLQGQAHRDMLPKPLTLQVTYPQPGTFIVTVQQVAKSGAHLKIAVDGKATEKDYPAGEKDYAPKSGDQALKVDVPQGAHTITVENTGKDWVVVKQFSLSDYAPALAANARVGRDFIAAWIYHRSNLMVPSADDSGLSPATGKVTLTGLQAGRYRVTWWDTHTGKSLDETDIRFKKEKDEVTLTTPSVTRDVAFYATKLSNRPPAKPNVTQGQRNGGNGVLPNGTTGTPTTGTNGTTTAPTGVAPQSGVQSVTPQTGGR
jgi:hypothetical protein